MLDINSFTTSIKNQVLGWLSSIGTNLICPLIAAAAAIYCIFQLPQLFKAHREGTSEVFWDFLWKEIIGLVGPCRNRRDLGAAGSRRFWDRRINHVCRAGIPCTAYSFVERG